MTFHDSISKITLQKSSKPKENFVINFNRMKARKERVELNFCSLFYVVFKKQNADKAT